MKKLKAQQITEFMLAVPLLIAFFVILTEFAFAFNTQLVLSNTLKSSVSSYGYKMSDVNRNYSYPNGNDIKAYVIENLTVGTEYNIKTKVRRKSNQLVSESSTILICQTTIPLSIL